MREIRVGSKTNRTEWKRSHHKILHPRDKKLARSHKKKLVATKLATKHASPSGNSGARARVGCFCGLQLADLEMVVCDRCGDSAHVECVKNTVVCARWRCAQCNMPQISQQKRALDDGARGMSAHLRNAEEARAAKKRARKEKEVETRVLAKKLADQGLCTVEIPADGHCLFSALSDQLKRTGCPVEHSYKSLRRAAAGYMMNNEQHFKGFLSLESATFESYCRRIERTNAWGGQHELIALSHVLERNIQVLRHDMSIQMFPDPETHTPYAGDPLRLSYHIHEYSGEHYNSVVSLEEKNRRSRATRVGRAEETGAPCAVFGSEGESSSAAMQPENTARVEKRPLTEAERLKKNGSRERKKIAQKAAKGRRKGVGFAAKPPVCWQRGVGGDNWRVVVWDTRSRRLIMGNSCPTAKNIDRYLEEKPYMKVWEGGVGDEPRAPIRAPAPQHSEGAASASGTAVSGTGMVSESNDTAEQEGSAFEDDSSGLGVVSDALAKSSGSGWHSENAAGSQGDLDVHGADVRGARDVLALASAAATNDLALYSVTKLHIDSQRQDVAGREPATISTGGGGRETNGSGVSSSFKSENGADADGSGAAEFEQHDAPLKVADALSI